MASACLYTYVYMYIYTHILAVVAYPIYFYLCIFTSIDSSLDISGKKQFLYQILVGRCLNSDIIFFGRYRKLHGHGFETNSRFCFGFKKTQHYYGHSPVSTEHKGSF